MRWQLAAAPATSGRRNLTGLRAPFLCMLLVLSQPLCTAAQSAKTVTLEEPLLFRLKLSRSLTSGRIRVGDYVQFEVAEDVKWTPDGGGDKVKIIEKGTPVFGQVVDRRRRFTIFKKGGFGIGKLWTTTVDGERMDLIVKRPELDRDEEKTRDEKDKEDLCEDKTLRKERRKVKRAASVPCVRGRVYAGSFISNLPSALLAVATAATLTRVKDDATSAVVGVTLADKFVSQPGLSNIINGVDAEMEGGEIFEATTVLTGARVIKLPGTVAEANKGVERVGRFTAPTPAGYIITDYFSDVLKYPSPTGQQLVYTGKVIERYTDKPVGSKMNMCEGQSLPDGWVIIDRVIDPKVCPREPGAPAQGHNFVVILKQS